MTQNELARELQNSHEAFVSMIASLSEQEFSYAEKGKWSAGLQLEHLNLCLKPLLLAFSLPGFLPKILYGVASTDSRSYEEVVAHYTAQLQNGGKAPSEYVPKPVRYAEKQHLEEQLKQRIHKLTRSMARYSEAELDRIRLPHPLMGKLSLREMLYFTLYHVRHHHKKVQAQLNARQATHP